MPAFNQPTDIADRALQLCGVPSLGPLGFNEQSARARAVSLAYGKRKRQELRRNVWQFSIRNAVLRPLDTDTLILAPTLWSSSVVYFLGSVVSDSNGTLWESAIPNNTGSNNQPGQGTTAWVPYFGPLSVMSYDCTATYFSGELVYTAPGDGTFNVYRSLVSGNGLDPSLPNIWSSAATYQQNQVVQTFPAWSSLTTYSAGQTVLYTDGNYYSSLVGSNLNNIPASTINSKWALMPILQLAPVFNLAVPAIGQPQGTLPQQSPVSEWNATQVYGIGSYVMFDANQYVSLVGSNTGNTPNAAGSSDWAQVTGGTLWMSLINLNINNNPTSTPSTWSSTATYSTGNTVAASDGYNYTSKVNSNLNNNPANGANPSDWTQGGFTSWTSSFTAGGGNQQWLLIGGASFPLGVGLTLPDIVYPIGSGPSSESATRNVFRLPAGWMKEAPQDPKAGSTSWLGAPSNLFYNDWEYRGNYIVSANAEPLIYWFCADVQDVTQFDDMFCQGLAAGVALDICEQVTQSTAKLGAIGQLYNKYMPEARIVNGIGTGADEAALDDYLTCRL